MAIDCKSIEVSLHIGLNPIFSRSAAHMMLHVQFSIFQRKQKIWENRQLCSSSGQGLCLFTATTRVRILYGASIPKDRKRELNFQMEIQLLSQRTSKNETDGASDKADSSDLLQKIGQTTTQGSETSQYLKEKKSKEIPKVVVSEIGTGRVLELTEIHQSKTGVTVALEGVSPL